jgi:hypothetical protein
VCWRDLRVKDEGGAVLVPALRDSLLRRPKPWHRPLELVLACLRSSHGEACKYT